MARLRHPDRSLRTKRVAFILALTLPTLGGAVFASAAPAQACSTVLTPKNLHCYAVAVSNDTTTNHGMGGDITSSCLNVSNDGNFASQEIWDANSSGTRYWEEVGLNGGADYSGVYEPNKTWFWAEKTPANGYSEIDDPENVAVAGTNIAYPVEITYSDGAWLTYGGNSEQLLVASGDQTAALDNGQAGTEYTSYHGDDTRDEGFIDDLVRESTAGTWYAWGNAATTNTGPGHYITGSYAAVSEEWDWSC